MQGSAESTAGAPQIRRVQRGWLTRYKAEQGKATRTGTAIGTGILVAWGAWYINDALSVYQGDEAWRLLVTPGIALLFAVIIGALMWRLVYVMRSPGDFMIATEGEMKKVSWSSRREVIGSTKVVILFTVLMAVLLFFVDLAFQNLFSWIGVLKVAG